MLALLSAVFGFAAPFLPELLKYFNRKQDNAHELAMMELRMKQAATEHTWKMAEIDAHADIEEMKTLRQPQQSFGVSLLDAAKGYNLSQWLFVPAFYLFSFLDFMSGMVRPTVTYAFVSFYIVVKIALFKVYTGEGMAAAQVVINLWGEQDWSVLVLVLSYWFGQRVAKAAFGGSASSAKPGR